MSGCGAELLGYSAAPARRVGPMRIAGRGGRPPAPEVKAPGPEFVAIALAVARGLVRGAGWKCAVLGEWAGDW